MNSTATQRAKKAHSQTDFAALSPDPTKPEPSVQVFVYLGTPSNAIGNDGDYYLEEETNLLYGPKQNGAWPEEGCAIAGPVLRKKKRIRQKAWLMAPPPKRHPVLRIWSSICKFWLALVSTGKFAR